MKVGDPCFLITRDAAWTIVRSAVDRVSRTGRFINVNGYRERSYIAGKEVFPTYREARYAAMAERDRLVSIAPRLGLSDREVKRLKALEWEMKP